MTRHRADRQQHVARHEEQAADQDRPAVAELPVGDPAADERAGVDEHQVVERRASAGAFVQPKPSPGLEVEGEHRHHRVEAEPLPHLGGEEDVQPFGVFFRFRLRLEKGGGYSGGHGCGCQTRADYRILKP